MAKIMALFIFYSPVVIYPDFRKNLNSAIF